MQINKEKIKEYFTSFKVYKNYKQLVYGVTFLVAVFIFGFLYLTSSPANIKEPFNFKIERGETINEIATKLKKEDLIRSEDVFKAMVILTSKDDKIISGDYLFNRKIGVFDLIDRLTIGDYGYEIITVTIPEGITNYQIGQILEQRFINFELDAFLQLSEGKEGYLFPDTYTFIENVRAHEIIEEMENNFDKRIAEISDVIESSEKTLEEIIIMASIIEEESTAEAKQQVSDILWGRIENNIPLQVDATFVYSIGKNSFTVTRTELSDDTNPYNTYQHLGLPPTAISNPGLASIVAAAKPQETDYVFFLTGRDGEMYYAETFEGHKQNRRRYLD
jgi:UPF0755 protein